MVTNPKHSQLLPVFIGQPLAMAVLVLLCGTMLSGMWAIAQACIEAWKLHGHQAFVPPAHVWHSFIVLGLGLGVMNIACDSVEVDINIASNAMEAQIEAGTGMMPKGHSVVTLLVVLASAVLYEMGLRMLFSGTFVLPLLTHPAFMLLESLVLVGLVLLLLRSHKRSFEWAFRSRATLSASL